MIWRAFDQVLSRSVVIHLLEPGDPRSTALLTAGRRAAGATDSRFLRVLDAVEDGGRAADGRTIGSYIVSEYAEGQSLQSVLAAAPLTGLESAWVVREVADALSGAHARGLFHRRLVPDMVIITPAGNVKIVGLLIEAALRPEEYPDTDPGADALEAGDVTDLGRLLYACLVARWPGEGVEDLPAAPTANGSAAESGHPWLTPRQVRHGVSPALDRICDQLLSPVPRQRAPRITTASALVGELDRILGTADATGDLERRLRHPQPSTLDDPDAAAVYAPPTPEAEPYAVIERNASIAAGTNTAESVTAPQGPDRPWAEVEEKPPSGPRFWIWALVIVLLLAALVLTVLTAKGIGPAVPLLPNSGNTDNNAAQREPRPSRSPVSSKPLSIVDAHDFDPAQDNPPQGGNGEENPELVKYAYDGNRSTYWHTLTYYGDPKFGRLKKGVGIVFDLGSAKTVGQVRVQLTGVGTDLQLRVPKPDAATVAQADMDSLKGWRTVAQQKGAGGSATLQPDEQVRTRYVLVFLTSLPKEGANYRGGIYEAEVLS
jgi:putative peptidoglycan lipid II flippase